MTTVLLELGKRYADRWVTVLVVPGLVFVAAAAVAITLGHGHALDAARLSHFAARLAEHPARLLPLVVLLPVLSLAVGAAATGVSTLLGRVWFEAWPHRLARSLLDRRRDRWNRAAAAFDAARDAATVPPGAEEQRRLDSLAARRNRIALNPPSRPTWMGDRLRAVADRVWAWYRLDLEFSWPRLWLLLSETEQQAVRTARSRVDSAAALAGWGPLYLLLTVWWWPASIIAVIVFAMGWWRSRAAVDALAHLVEAGYDLHAVDLAVALGFEVGDGTLSPNLGAAVTAHLRKNA